MGNNPQACRADLRVLRRTEDHPACRRSALGGAAVVVSDWRGEIVKPDQRHNLRLLPAVDRVLNLAQVALVTAQHGRAVVTTWIREVLAMLRNGEASSLPPDVAAAESLVVQRVSECASRTAAQRL